MKLLCNYLFIIVLTVRIIFGSIDVEAQISQKGLPESFLMEQKKAVIIPSLKLDSIRVQKMIESDEKFKIDNRYGVVQQLGINIKEAGVKTEIEGKGSIWQYKIESHDAYSLGIFFKTFHLPPKAKVFIYDSSHRWLRGAFTQNNNSSGKQLPIAEFPGKNMVIEYFEPLSPEFSGELVLGSVSQAYNNLQRVAEDRIGINCKEGDEWQTVKHSVCLMTFHDFESSYFCTGALMNNVKEDEAPYFLTANHCVNSELTAATLVTYFNYENSTCDTVDATFSQTLAGATFKAGSSYSDFTLLLLNEYPPDEYNPFYAGWDVSGNNPRSGACMHHPEGEPKSIAIASNTAFSYPQKIEWYSEDLRLISTTLPDTHWHVLFDQGMPEAGSSGGPYFDQNKRIVGQLHGGVNSVLLFGKLSLSWNHFSSPTKQLAYWLDPLKTTKTLDGIWKLPPKANFRAELEEVCVNSPILISDKSLHKPTEWLWRIEPSTYSYTNGTDSTSQNPQVLFKSDGIYTVMLLTSNKYGSDELIKKKYILAQSKLNVSFLKTRSDSLVCGCDLKAFPLFASGAVKYSFKIDRPELIDTTISSNTLFLTLNPYTKNYKSFDTWVKVTGTNGNCTSTDSILLHILLQPNDLIANATMLYLGRNTGFSNKCATGEINEPSPPSSGCLNKMSWCPDFTTSGSLLDNSIWFTFFSPSDESTSMISIDTDGFDNQIAVYKASSISSISSGSKKQYTLIDANDNRSMSNKNALIENMVLEPRTQYWLQVDGNNAAYGDISIDLFSSSLEAVIFPNPSRGPFKLIVSNIGEGNATVTISDLNGRKFYTGQYNVSINSNKFDLDLSGYAKGIYLLNVSMNGSNLSKKLLLK